MIETRNYLVRVQRNEMDRFISLRFELFYPRKDTAYYGTGCYMCVSGPSDFEDYVDVRYAGTTDLQKLSESWLSFHYGEAYKERKEI